VKSTSEPDDRVTVIQTLIDSRQARNYLEIGVKAGSTFFWIRARKKMAVDPQFIFSMIDRLKWLRWNPYNVFNEYYPVRSDSFFSEESRLLEKRGLYVVFVDGLHTYEQSLRDIENSVRFLRHAGVILVDDCIRPNDLS